MYGYAIHLAKMLAAVSGVVKTNPAMTSFPPPRASLRDYPETLSLHCSEITQLPCGNETPDDHHE